MIKRVSSVNIDNLTRSVLNHNFKMGTWTFLTVTWSTPPVFNSAIAGGSIYTYTLDGISRYRFVPSPYDPTEDAFYEDLGLTTLIAKRG